MQERPGLTPSLDSGEFLKYYYLKEELVCFCRENGLPVSGGKQELTLRIARFLETGEISGHTAAARKRTAPPAEITGGSFIPEGVVCSEALRAFFTERLGKGFRFSTAFQKWLKENAGKTFDDAAEAYRTIAAEGKSRKTQIGRQFEYNTYIRDFFAANPGKKLGDAIICWKHKKSLPGHNRYEDADLAALDTGDDNA